MTAAAGAPPAGAILEWIEPYAGTHPAYVCPWWVRVYDPDDAHKKVIRDGPPPLDWRRCPCCPNGYVAHAKEEER
jgi:hypothetical protein